MFRPLKPIGPDLRDGIIGDEKIMKLTGAPSHIRQFEITTFAVTKIAAAEQLGWAFGRPYKSSELRVQMGNDAEVLQDSGLPIDDGAVYVWHRSLSSSPIVRVIRGEVPRVVGHWQQGTDRRMLKIVLVGQSDLPETTRAPVTTEYRIWCPNRSRIIVVADGSTMADAEQSLAVVHGHTDADAVIQQREVSSWVELPVKI